MGLKSEQQVFLTQEDQDDHDINQFQTKSGDSFDFKKGYDSVVYEVHKQYKLRTRTIDVFDPIQPKDAKQPKKVKDKAAITEPADKTNPKLKEVTIEDVSDMHPSNNQPFVSFPSKENVNSTPQSLPKTEQSQEITDNQEKIIEDKIEKGKSASHNTKTQSKKPFDLEA